MWLYRDSVNDQGAVRDTFASKHCLFCQEDLYPLRSDSADLEGRHSTTLEVKACARCGWWIILKTAVEQEPSSVQMWTSASIGELRELDLHDDTAPLEEVRSYLVARYELRFDIDPILFERLVASVYGDLGYSPLSLDEARMEGWMSFSSRGTEP